jgi:transposase
MRDLVRARLDATMQLMRARQLLLEFLLRHGRTNTTGGYWTQRHRSWLAGQTFDQPAHQVVFQDYVEAVLTAQERRDQLIQRIATAVSTWSLGPVVEALRGLRGLDLVSAATLVAMIGDLTRFETPRQLMAYLGLTPSEHSSGGSTRRGGITKTGNSEARRMLVEASWSYRYPARVAKEKMEIIARLPKPVRDIAWKAQLRLCSRYRRLTATGKKSTVAVTAIARELCGFVWAIGQEVKPATP